MKEYNYFWSKGSRTEDEIAAVQACIDAHDFDKFLYFREAFNKTDEKCLPDEISVYDNDTDQIEWISALDPENFSRIEYSKCRA